MRHQEIQALALRDAEEALRRDDPKEVSIAVLAVALHDPHPLTAQAFCLRLVTHPNANVRGNAILGLGHIARIHRKLNLSLVTPIIRSALVDPDPYVRGHAESAASDVEVFLGVSIR